MEVILKIAQVASYFCTIVAALTILIKPIRERIFHIKKANEGEKCLLRSEILRIYYSCLPTKTIRQFELENYLKLYDAYKALGGNSFVDTINKEIREWTCVQ